MTNKFSNLSSRVAVAIVAIPIILGAGYYGSWAFGAFVIGVGVLSLHELFGLARAKGIRPQEGLAIAALVFLHLAFFRERIMFTVLPWFIDGGGIAFLGKLQLVVTVLFLAAVLVFTVELFRNAGSAIVNASVTMLGVVYIGVFLGSLIGVRELFGSEFPLSLVLQQFPGASPLSDDAVRAATDAWGGMTIIAIFASIWMCDTAAYFGGLSMGKHKLFPRVSPNKSWEGAVWGFIGAVATMVVMRAYFLPYMQVHQAALLGVIIGVFGQIGDLFESLLKRDAGVKDSSAIIPGHGGILDRFDSLIFVSPIIYLYIDFVILS